ncbi:hypothetical protein ACFJGW_06310 [Burkholderiaceae bacterium UC74_6]
MADIAVAAKGPLPIRFAQLSTWFDIDSSVIEQPRMSAFDRILVMRMTGNEIRELRLTKATP